MIEVTLKKKRFSILDYVERRTASFSKAGFSEIDSLVFAQFSYMDFSRMIASPEEPNMWVPISSLFKAEEFKYLLQNTFFPVRNKRFLTALCASPRYRNVLVNFYVRKYDKESEEQFSAISFRLPTGETVVAFRGTDPTIVGWKENFNMLYLAPVPSQRSAVQYLEQVASHTTGDIYVTGHSKGGNLAVYSVLFAKEEIRNRVVNIYDLDGPGFPVDVVGYNQIQEMEKKVIKLRPEGSIVGIIFESMGEVKIVKSSNAGMKQHDAYTWQVNGNSFLQGKKATYQVRHMNKTLNVLAYDLDRGQRKVVVDTIYALFAQTKSENLFDLAPSLFKEKETVAKSLKEMDEDTANCIKAFMKGFVRISLQSVFTKEQRQQMETTAKKRKKSASSPVKRVF